MLTQMKRKIVLGIKDKASKPFRKPHQRLLVSAKAQVNKPHQQKTNSKNTNLILEQLFPASVATMP